MRKPIIAGNWKLNKNISESCKLAHQLTHNLGDVDDREIIIAPVFTALSAVHEIVEKTTIHLAGQNCYPATSGAFTGELSPNFLQDAGCKYVLIGHSERRQLLNESDSFINQKLLKVLETGLQPILCVGETLQQRESDQMPTILSQQIETGLVNITTTQMADVVIAYEPVWAIGTGKTATSQQAQEAHQLIRNLLQQLFNLEVATQTRILYGGSVKPDNIDTLMQQEDIDGALVGGASLKAEDFIRIVRFKKQ